MSKKEQKEEYKKLLHFLAYTLHELPSGVLYDANGADASKCAELMKDTYRLEELSAELGLDNSGFIEQCRWHYERYPHYLSRHRHFGSYENYMAKYNAPKESEANELFNRTG
ncbi:hypothetical protein ABHF33_12880 [Chitinibacter sp. FCG-7]|uniref:Uncharacterized protein n=1 Tax=Chitinibacter mangrovi TaxID=3153927 RepID=A0AAU7F893_9NEIS